MKHLKPKIEIKSEQASKFMSWVVDKWLYEGDPWLEWWQADGMKSFELFMQNRIKKSQ
jgi:hypothetical protein